MKRLSLVLVAAIGLAGSAIGLAGPALSYEPVVDMQGVDSAKYKKDLGDCQQYAEKEDPGQDAAVSGAGAAATGAALGAIFGGGSGAATGAASGGVTGAAGGATTGVEKQHQIIDNCMRGRGYKLLN